MPRTELVEFMEQQRERGRALGAAADEVRDNQTYRDWTHEVERWDALTRDGLRAAYARHAPADEFFEAATGGIVRSIMQNESETLH